MAQFPWVSSSVAIRGSIQSPRALGRRALTTVTTTTRTGTTTTNGTETEPKLVRIPEASWRTAALKHRQRIFELLQPGLTDPSHPINAGQKRWNPNQEEKKKKRLLNLGTTSSNNGHDELDIPSWTALDPKNPVYNFLIEYYGLKGSKGPRRLARWSPCPSLLLSSSSSLLLSSLNEKSQQEQQLVADGILLEGADFVSDVGDILHLRGAMPHDEGIVYNPRGFFAVKNPPPPSPGKEEMGETGTDDEHKNNINNNHGKDMTRISASKAALPYLWYRSILQQTLTAEPVLHCHGLHEWAMQYQPSDNAPAPPSAKYQAHLPLRVSRQVIADVVERQGIHCTHVDALKYFSPAATLYNHYGASLERLDQLRLEQPACVHAHMDLIKIVLRLQPFVNATLISRVVDLALQARRLDVAASPYDGTAYDGVSIVPIETPEGRAEYRHQQQELMRHAQVLRRELLDAYHIFLYVAFDPIILQHAETMQPDAERFAQTQPGGLPWRRNLVQEVTSSEDSSTSIPTSSVTPSNA